MTTIHRRRRLGRAAAAGALALVGAAGLASPAGAASNTFAAEYASAAWTTDAFTVELSPGEHDDRGTKSEYLHTKITGTYCVRGYRFDVALEKSEEARDLNGVSVKTTQIGDAEAEVNRKTSVPGTLTKTPVAADCVTPTGEATVTNINPTVKIEAAWGPTGAPIAYSGEDCGGDGACNYVDAAAEAKVEFMDHDLDLGEATSDTWMWNGTWALA